MLKGFFNPYPMKTIIADFQYLVNSNASMVRTGDKEFFFLPFWFEHIKDNEFIMHRLGDNLPEELKQAIHSARGTKESAARQFDFSALDEILDKLELGTISAEQAKTKIKELL
jgi:hypothetical protein